MKHVIEFSRRLNDADARFFFLGERRDCNVAMVMVSVLGGPVSLPALVEEFVPDEGGVPRFADYLRRAPLGLAPPVWTPLPAEERVTEYYGREIELSPGQGWEEVLAIVDEIQSTPFRPDRAPWEVAVISGAADGRTVLVMKAHHVLSDGMALAMLLAKTLAADTLAAVGMEIEVATEPPLRGPRLWLAIRDRAGAVGRWLRFLVRTLPELAGAEGRRRELAAFGRLRGQPRRWPLGEHGRARRLAAFRVPTTAWLSEAESRGGGSNELFLALTARIARLLLDRADFDAEPVRVGMPVTTRVGDTHEGGNSAEICVLELAGTEAELADLTIVRARAREARREMPAESPTLVEATLELLPGSLQAAVNFRRGAAFDVLATNIPVALGGKILGVPVEEMLMVAPAIGQSLSFSLTAYGEHFFFSANADRALLPDPIAAPIEQILVGLFGERCERFGAGMGGEERGPQANGEADGTIRWDRALKGLTIPD